MRSILRDAIYRKHKECKCTRGECNRTRSIALLGNGIFYSISRDHNQPIKQLELNKVLYNKYLKTRERLKTYYEQSWFRFKHI